MKVLVIGNGGREHALRWKLQRSPSVTEVFTATSDYVHTAESLGADLTVVGPEVPLVEGVVDQFRQRRMPIVGPTAANAALEGSKTYSKQLMQKLGIPTAASYVAVEPGLLEVRRQLPDRSENRRFSGR